MSLRIDIKDAQVQAMKDKDSEKLSILRMVWSAVKNEEIEKKEELKDDEVQAIVARQVKQQKDAMKDFVSGGREDLVEKAKSEISLLEEYLPSQLGDDELRPVLERIISELGVSSASDVGLVMGAAMKELRGRVDGNKVRVLVSELLPN